MMSNKKGGLGKFLGGIAIGAGLGVLFAPDKGENTRKILSKKIDELLKKVNDIDLDEVKDELLFRAESLQALDTEKAKELVLEQAENIKEKAEELYKYAIEKGTPVVEKAADDVRKQALKIVREAEKKLSESKKAV